MSPRFGSWRCFRVSSFSCVVSFATSRGGSRRRSGPQHKRVEHFVEFQRALVDAAQEIARHVDACLCRPQRSGRGSPAPCVSPRTNPALFAAAHLASTFDPRLRSTLETASRFSNAQATRVARRWTTSTYHAGARGSTSGGIVGTGPNRLTQARWSAQRGMRVCARAFAVRGTLSGGWA